MSTSSGARNSRWLQRISHVYSNVTANPFADEHAMLDFNVPSPAVLDPDAFCLQSSSTPLLKLPDAKTVIASNDSLGEDGKEEEDPKSKYFQGWHMGVTICAVTSGAVLMINVILTIVASTKFGLKNGIGTLQEGSCQVTKDLSLWLHLAINVLSTLLLGASNYCMQCLASPTREEIDVAHSRHVWLDIGIPSVRNLKAISWDRRALWWLLAISTVPLHLLWNSAVFSVLSSQRYSVFVGSPDLFKITGLDWSTPIPGSPADGPSSEYTNHTLQRFRNASSWERLDNIACIKAYAQDYISARGDLLAISSNINTSIPVVWIEDVDGAASLYNHWYDWICNSYPSALSGEFHQCDINSVLQYSGNWTITFFGGIDANYLVQYCLSKPVDAHCRVQFSIAIMSVVIGCNCLKVMCMILILRYQRSQPLVTLGDAITSFLGKADPTTENLCLAEKDWFSRKSWGRSLIKWKGQRYWWFSSASTKRWLTCNILYISVLIAASCLLRLGLYAGQSPDRSLAHLWQMGLGTVNQDTMTSVNLGLIPTVIVLNSPQLLLSFLFLTYNGLFTCMLLSNEWNGYAYERKSLRVTNPTGTQRSTYRLQLPYKYGIPSLVISGTLHWLVSQSLFLALVIQVNASGYEEPLDWILVPTQIGYSCIAIIIAIFFGSIVVLLIILNGFRRYKPGIPLVGSCSAAISAACHQPKDDSDAAIKPLMWGVVSTKDGVGHCCFTSFEVTPPVEGELYAGFGE